MFRNEADDGLRVVVHGCDDVDEAEGSKEHVLVAMEVTTFLK